MFCTWPKVAETFRNTFVAPRDDPSLAVARLMQSPAQNRKPKWGLNFPWVAPNYVHGTLVPLWYTHRAFASYPFYAK